MEARKLNQNQRQDRFIDALIDTIGVIPIPEEEWLPQVHRYENQGLVAREFFVHTFTHVYWFREYARTPIYNFSKRIFDLIVGLVLLVAVIPFFILFGIFLKLDSPGPIFFKQIRLGQFGAPFEIWKFRTMYEGSPAMLASVKSDSIGGFFKVQSDPRITRVGLFLRRWSLDELPQLINVVLGHMSLVGPRPLPVYDVVSVPYSMIIRFSVIPGMTGLWQTTARSSNNGQANLAIDANYVRNRSWKLDLWILLRTPVVVITGIGAR